MRCEQTFILFASSTHLPLVGYTAVFDSGNICQQCMVARSRGTSGCRSVSFTRRNQGRAIFLSQISLLCVGVWLQAHHSAAIDVQGRVMLWGQGKFGQLVRDVAGHYLGTRCSHQ